MTILAGIGGYGGRAYQVPAPPTVTALPQPDNTTRPTPAVPAQTHGSATRDPGLTPELADQVRQVKASVEQLRAEAAARPPDRSAEALAQAQRAQEMAKAFGRLAARVALDHDGAK